MVERKMDYKLDRPLRLLLDADLLRTFLVIAELGSVTKAADAIGRAQSATSAQLQKLETTMGVDLFEREARGVKLTAAGVRLLPAARRMVDNLIAMRSMFDSSVQGKVRLGVAEGQDADILHRILRKFSLECPQVEVSVRCAFSSAFPELVKTGQLDLAIHIAENDEGVGHLLRKEEMVWAAGRHWARTKHQPIPLALFDQDCWWRHDAIEALTKAEIPFQLVFESESVWSVKSAIASGLAVGIIASRMVERSMKIFGEGEGFPHLKPTDIVLLTQEEVATSAVETMTEVILSEYKNDGEQTRHF